MNAYRQISSPTRQIPLAVSIGLCSILLLGLISYAVYLVTYHIAIKELREHEIVDLADETLKNADGLKAILTQLREDVLTLSQHAKLQDLLSGDAVANKALRSELGDVFIDVCRAHKSNEPVNVDVPRWKHYMQVRLITPDGHERIRTQLRESETQTPAGLERMVSIDVATLDDEAGKGKSSKYYKGDRDYFLQARDIFEKMGSGVPGTDPAPLFVFLSAAGFNEEWDVKSVMHSILTIRAAVPLTRVVNHQLQFRGILIINLNLESVIKNLTDSARHLVYLGAGEASRVPGGAEAGPRLIYNPRYLTVQRPGGRRADDDSAAPFADFEAVLRRQIRDSEQFENELAIMFAAKPERAEWGRAGNDSVLPLEARGQRIPNDALGGDRLTLSSAHQFYLIKLDVSHPAPDNDKAKDFYAELSEYLKGIQSDSVRTTPLVHEKSNVISIRGADREELMSKVVELETTWRGLITRRYQAPVLCASFAAHYYRIYFDPRRPQRYLALLVGFSDEELAADLLETRGAAFRAFSVTALGGGTLFLLFLWWFVTRPINQLTTAAAKIACGEYDAELPTRKRDEIGQLSRTFAIMVNEVRARDEEIRLQNEELDEKVRSRTASLAEARDQLEAAVKARDAFVATVSHELRTPINHISGYAQLLEFTQLDEEQRSDLEKLQGSARHLLRLVQDILDYQKIIMGRLPVTAGHFEIAKLLKSVCESNQPKAAQRGNDLVLEISGLGGSVFNDENRLRQILDNLVGNACKFTTSGTITIDARADGAYLAIAVTDTGVGISEQAMQQLFQPFSKVADSSLNPDGTGLGLVISRQLARNMGGDLTVTSVPKKGSTFLTTVLRELPADSSAGPFTSPANPPTTMEQPATNDAPLGPAERSDSPSGEPERRAANQVLVIDDDPNARELITRFLRDEGLTVITASSGAEGIELAGRHLPSVITLDLVMPDVHGWSVLAALKANERTAGIPVVLVSVLDDPQQGYAFGATDYIAKPIEGNRLTEVVRRYCGEVDPCILVIDDNPKDREIVSRVLKNAGCRIVEAVDGADGLRKFEEVQPDLIVLDLMMPVMDGFQFAEEVRQLADELPPIIVLTAKEMTPDNCHRLSGMVSEVVQKGQFDRGRFLQEIHRHLRQPSDPS